MGASPVYTRRMQRALGFEGDSVETIFKGMQLDVGAPPQFMDFRYRISDHDHGEFWLDHCGALMDVEPMGPDYVVAMCHDIEDPTFEATAIATNPRAQVRPIHRPPRVPADRTPHCHWTVTIADDHPPSRSRPRPGSWRPHGRPTSSWPRSTLTTPVVTTTPVPSWPTSDSRSGRPRPCGGSSTRCACRATCSPCRSSPRPGAADAADGAGLRPAAVHRRGRRGGRPVPGRARPPTDPGGGGPAARRCTRVCSPTTTSAATSSSATAWCSGWAGTPTPRSTAPGRPCSTATTWPPSMPWSGPSTPTSGATPPPTATPWSWRWCGASAETRVADEVVLTRFSTGTTYRFEDRGTPVELRSGGRSGQT